MATLGDLVSLSLSDVLDTRNLGRTTVRAVIEKAQEQAETHGAAGLETMPPDPLAVAHPSPSRNGGLADRWERAHRLVSQAGLASTAFTRSGLPKRARSLLDDSGLSTVGAILALDLRHLRQRPNIGTGTLDAILRRIESLCPGDSGSEPQASVSFVAMVDHLLTRTKAIERDVVLFRFRAHLTLRECGERLGVTRERIRQLERRFLTTLVESCRDAGWAPASILEDGFIEFSELCGRDPSDPAFSTGLYVTLARAVLLGVTGSRQLDAFYRREFEVLLDDLGDSRSALAGNLDDQEILQRAAALTPALLEWPPEKLVSRVRKATVRTPRLTKPRTGRIRLLPLLRATIRDSGGEMSLAALRHRLNSALAAAGILRVLNDNKLRALVQRSRDFYMRDTRTIAPFEPELQDERGWVERAVKYILQNRRPTSLTTFLDQHPHCQVDVFTFAHLLNQDPRVERVGRRLYCAAGNSPGLVRVVDILLQALRSEPRPWSHSGLRDYVRQRRDLMSNQIEPYLARVPGLVRYSLRCVGLKPLSRTVMLQLLTTEQFILDRLSELARDSAATVEEIWLDEAGDDDRLTGDEAETIRDATTTWRRIRLYDGNPLRFSKEEV